MTTESKQEKAAEITCAIDNGFSKVVDLLGAVEAAEQYILCLRQLVYAADKSVIDAAYSRVDALGSKWYAAVQKVK